MNRSKLLAAAAVLASLMLAGCANLFPGGPRTTDKESLSSSVYLKDGKLTVDPKILLVGETASEATITWTIASGSGVTFTDKGIVIEGEVVFPSDARPEAKGRAAATSTTLSIDPQRKSNFTCERDKDPLKFVCKSSKLEGGVYKYAVQLQSANGSQVFNVDPPIVVMRPPPGR